MATMRATTLLRKLVGIKQTLVVSFGAEDDALVLGVRPSWQVARCSRCGRKSWSIHQLRPGRRWRHLDFGGIRVLLQYDLRRITCRKCGVVVEAVPWSDEVMSRFTQDFEDHVAWMAQRMDKTSVEKLMQIAWRTVGRIIERVVRRKRPEDPLANLTTIGVDELSYRKHHRYITLVTDHDKGSIVWGKKGKDAAALLAFFDELGEERCKQIEFVTMDMSSAYISAVREKIPHAQIVFDRFHVQKLVTKALETTRRQEQARLRGTDEAAELKGLRWALLKRSWNLTPGEHERLSVLPRRNNRLYRAYLLSESLAALLDRRQPNVVKRKLESWLAWASRSRLPAFVRVAKTIRKHMADILAYIRCRLTNGLIEGLNNKARVLTRRAYGFHSADAVIAMIMLCCSGLTLEPVHKRIDG